MTVRSVTGVWRAQRARALCGLALLAAVTLAGCDDDGGGEDAGAQSQGAGAGEGTGEGGDGAAPEQTEAEPVEPPTEPADIEIQAGERSASASGGSVTVNGPHAAFVTPTGNIACVLTGAGATCQVLDKTYTAPVDQLVSPSVGSCTPAEADAMTLAADSGAWTCVPEPLVPSAASEAGGWWETEVDGDTLEVDGVRVAVLPYAQSLQVGSVQCASAEDGVTCSNQDTGRTFFISRSGYRYG